MIYIDYIDYTDHLYRGKHRGGIKTVPFEQFLGSGLEIRMLYLLAGEIKLNAFAKKCQILLGLSF